MNTADSHSRRNFLSLAGFSCAGAAALALGSPPALADDPWGKFADPTVTPTGFFPGGQSFYKVLEIHLYGGLSPWETFYHRPLADNRGWRGFGTPGDRSPDVISDLHWSGATDASCRYGPTSPAQTVPFDTDDTSHPIHVGPATSPLWSSDIFDRMRVVVLQHDLLPHEAAIPYAASGFRLGRPELAGLGAAVQRKANDLNSRLPEFMRRREPWSYVVIPTTIRQLDNLQAYFSSGIHGGINKPIVINIGPEGIGGLLPLLNREDHIGPEKDALLDVYRSQYRRRFVFPGISNPVRSAALEAYDTIVDNAYNSSSIKSAIESAPLDIQFEAACADVEAIPSTTNLPYLSGTALRVAAALLNHPTAPAHYACAVDAGIQTASGGGGYDTHTQDHLLHTNLNLYHILATLRDLIDEGVVNLDTTLIVINTEFGRTPWRTTTFDPDGMDPNGNGRNHWPNGYANVLIGGPIVAGQRKVLGRINDTDGFAAQADVYTSTDIRAAALIAAGIDPFAAGLFGVGDISLRLRTADDEDQTSKNIRNEFFGIP